MFLVLTLFLYLRTPQSTVLSACFFLSGVLVHGGGGGGGGFSFASKNNNINWKNLIIFEFTILFFFFFADFDSRYFWNWTDFRSYVEFIASFTLVASFITWLLLGYVIYVEALGFTSLLIEAMLGVPQFYDNFVSKSTFGMRYSIKILLYSSSFLVVLGQ